MIIPASDKQVSYVRDLILKREVDPDEALDVINTIDAGLLDKGRASELIERFIGMPRKKNAVPSELDELLSRIPKSKYAVTAIELSAADIDEKIKDDLVFVEIKEYLGRRYIRRLFGSPGQFSRSTISAPMIKAIVETIEYDPYKYARLFGEHYTCCGSCGAPLTDNKSRELMLGPECRKKFSL